MNGIFSYPLLLQALLATLLTWLLTALGAAMVFLTRRRHTSMDGMLAFGAGVMLASAFWSLLEPGVALADELGQRGWLVSSAGFLAGGALVLLGDLFTARMHRAAPDPSQRRSAMLIGSITLHNVPEGLAVGVAFGALTGHMTESGLTGAWMLAIGVALQNFPEGAAVSLPLRREGMSRARAFFFGQLSGAVEPVSALIGGALASSVRGMLPFLLCLAAGCMVAVVIAELIPESQRNSHPPRMTLAALSGFVLMMALDVALG